MPTKLVAYTLGRPEDEAAVKQVKSSCKRAGASCAVLEVKPLTSKFSAEEISQFEKGTGEKASPLFCIEDAETHQTIRCTLKVKDIKRAAKEGFL